MSIDVTKEVWNNYIDLNTTHRIILALKSTSGYYPLRILAYGKQGSGKTTFMYYAVKVAFTYYLCHKDGVRKDECLDYALKEFNLCLGRDCPRDQVDEELLPGFYLTINDLLNRFIEDVATGEIAKRRVVFFDDAFTPRDWWNAGGTWRKLYFMARRFDQFYRDHINVLVLTAPSIYYFTKEYIVNSLVLQFNAIWENGDAYTVAYRFIFPLYTSYHYGKSYLRRVMKLDYVDKVPFRHAYGLPKWLEELNTARREFVLRETARRALEAIRGGGE